MRSRWPIILLAVGLGFLHVMISITFGPSIATALVTGIGIAYAAFNLLLGRPKDDPKARTSLARIMAVSKVTYVANAIVWLSAIGLAAYPAVDRMLRDEFTITVIDEKRQPVDALVEVRLGGKTLPVSLDKGIGRVAYYPSADVRSAQIIVDNKGIVQTVEHRANSEGRFADIVIPIWTGEPPLSVAHLTASGVAIDAFLHGDLPGDLRERYPRVTVIRSPVLDRVREFLAIYPNLEWGSDNLDYSRAETAGTGRTNTVNVNAYSGDSDAWFQSYQARMMNRRFASQMMRDFELDFSSDLLGASVDRPLPDGFLGYLNPEDEWNYGAEAVPDLATDAWLKANLRNATRSPNGAVSLRLERLLAVSDLNSLAVREARKGEDANPSIIAYLRYMIQHGLPEGLIRAAIHLEPGRHSCDERPPHLSIELPEPEMRFTLLKNVSDKPLKLDSLILTLQMRDKLQRASDRAPQQESSVPSDVLAPGEAVLVPRELTIKAIYTDAEIAQFHTPAGATVGTFNLPPRLPPGELGSRRLANATPGYYGRPKQLKVAVARLQPWRPAYDEIQQGQDFAQRGATYFVGPSVSEIDYVVNGVRIRARSDNRIAIAMIGGMEIGSCPFVFAQYFSAPRPLNLGQIITDQIGIGAKGIDRVSIPAGFSRLEIRERENEISYLDSARLVVRRSQGDVHFRARNPQLNSDDGRYAILRKGDLVKLDFGYVPQPGDGEVALEVNGYYDPVPRSASR